MFTKRICIEVVISRLAYRKWRVLRPLKINIMLKAIDLGSFHFSNETNSIIKIYTQEILIGVHIKIM